MMITRVELYVRAGTVGSGVSTPPGGIQLPEPFFSVSTSDRILKHARRLNSGESEICATERAAGERWRWVLGPLPDSNILLRAREASWPRLRVRTNWDNSPPPPQAHPHPPPPLPNSSSHTPLDGDASAAGLGNVDAAITALYVVQPHTPAAACVRATGSRPEGRRRASSTRSSNTRGGTDVWCTLTTACMRTSCCFGRRRGGRRKGGGFAGACGPWKLFV
ncbi:hypothetical protein C8R44DRAFT_751941 [Mycena epipterygia]|nr:hypothetical protein C8R44DRAFT_751941 [Mycena epipterygia]